LDHRLAGSDHHEFVTIGHRYDTRDDSASAICEYFNDGTIYHKMQI